MKSDYLELRMLDHVLGGPTYLRPSTIYVGLNLSDPTDAGLATEPVGGAYDRVAVVNNSTNWPAANAFGKRNGTTILFPRATSPWGIVTHFSLWDAASGGNLIRRGLLTPSVLVALSDRPRFPGGSLVCTET